MSHTLSDEMINNETENMENHSLSIPKEHFYTFTVDANLYEKLENHLFALRVTEGKNTKRAWVAQSIREKLKNDDPSIIPKEKRLNIAIAEPLLIEIDKRVDLQKQFRTSYSKKQWLVEAIYEKLNRDNKLIQDKIQKIKSNIF